MRETNIYIYINSLSKVLPHQYFDLGVLEPIWGPQCFQPSPLSASVLDETLGTFLFETNFAVEHFPNYSPLGLGPHPEVQAQELGAYCSEI